MDDLLRYKFDQRYMLFDTETEGLNLIMSRPWQVSWLVAEGKKIISRHNHFLSWEGIRVSEGAAFVTGFDMKEYIRLKEDPYHVFSMFWKDANREDTILCGHNLLGFDNYILNIWRLLLDLPPDYLFVKRILDTKALSMAVQKGLQKPDGIDLAEWQYRLSHVIERGVKTNLKFMLKYFDIDFDPERLHEASYDIECNFKLLHKLLGVLDI